MKIAYDAKRLFKNRTGLGNYSRALINQLLIHFPDAHYLLYGSEPKSDKLYKIIAENQSVSLHYSKSFSKTYWRSFGIIKDLKADRVDLYHGLSNELPFGIQNSGIPSIVTIHDLVFKHYPKTFPFIDRQIYDFKFKSAAKNANKVIAISESTKQDLQKFYSIPASQIEVIYQSCDPLFYSEAQSSVLQEVKSKYRLPESFMLCVSSLESRKNIETLLSAYALIKQETQIPLLIVGRGKLSAALKSQASQLGIADKVFFQESVNSTEELQAFYSLANLLIYPSKYEGFGLPIAEALLSKTPVIAADNSSLREAGGPDSLYFETMDAQHLRSQIELLLSNFELQEKMKLKSYAHALKEFDLKTQSEKLMQLYSEVLKK